MDPPRFTFLTAVGTAALSGTATKQMRSHITKSNFAKRRARAAGVREEATDRNCRHSFPEKTRQGIVSHTNKSGCLEGSLQDTRGYEFTRTLSLNWSLLFLDGSDYPATASESAWVSLLISEPALAESSMAVGLRHWSPDIDYQVVACNFLSKATETVIERISSGRGATDAVLAAVLTMAFGERLVHNKTAWNIHIDGAVQLVHERISRGLPALSEWLEDLLIKDIINDAFGFPRFYHKKMVDAVRIAHDFQCPSLMRIVSLCESLTCWLQAIEACRKRPHKSEFIMEHIVQPMHGILSQSRTIRTDARPALRASCVTIELIIYQSWGSLQDTVNLTAVSGELKDAMCPGQFRPCCYSDLTSCQLMIGAMAADEGSSTKAWFMDKMKIAWRMVKSRGCHNVMDILRRNMVFKAGLEARFESLWIELDSQTLS